MPGLVSLTPEQPQRIRENFPTWTVVELEEGDAMIGCPKMEGRCGNQAIVHLSTWLSMPGKTRACPYCFKASRVPDMEITPSEEM